MTTNRPSHILSRIEVSVTNNNGFWIRWLDVLALLYNYNQLQQFPINDRLRLAPFLAGAWAFSLPLWRMTKDESLLTHWTLTERRLKNLDSVITSRRPEYKSPSQTVNCPPVVIGMSLFRDLLHSNDSLVAICCSGKVTTEPLLSNGLFRHSITILWTQRAPEYRTTHSLMLVHILLKSERGQWPISS
jgi:hypothetical protein